MGWSVASAVTDGGERGRIVNAQSAATARPEPASSPSTPTVMSVARTQRQARGPRGRVPAGGFFAAIPRLIPAGPGGSPRGGGPRADGHPGGQGGEAPPHPPRPGGGGGGPAGAEGRAVLRLRRAAGRG